MGPSDEKTGSPDQATRQFSSLRLSRRLSRRLAELPDLPRHLDAVLAELDPAAAPPP